MQGIQRGQLFHYQLTEYDVHANNQSTFGGTSGHGQTFYQNSQSLAESTIATHSGNYTQPAHNNVKTKLNEKNGQLQPYYRPADYISDYPITFKGCFNCSKTDHWRTADCQYGKTGNLLIKRDFLKKCEIISHIRSATT